MLALPPLPYHGYDFSLGRLAIAAARAERIGWATVARESGRKWARWAAANERACSLEYNGIVCNQADAHERSAVLLDYAARVAYAKR